MSVIQVDKVLNTVQNIASKNQTGGYLSPKEASNFMALAQMEVINEMYQFLDANRSASMLIGGAIKEAEVAVLDGYIETPDDYRGVITFYSQWYGGGQRKKEFEAELLNHTEIGERFRSQIDYPSPDYPVIVKDEKGIKVYPKHVSKGRLVYIYEFEDPVYATTGTPPTYDPITSVQFVISDLFFDLIVYKVCLLFGISVKDENLQQTTVRSVLKAL